MSAKSLDVLNDQSLKHATVLAQKQDSVTNLEIKLHDQMDSLIYTLFPEGPTKTTSKQLRFGTKGSLVINCKDNQSANFYDFEKREGGGLVRLIQTRLNLNFKETIQWVNKFLGEDKPVIPSQFSFKKQNLNKEIAWTSIKPDPFVPAPSLNQIAPKLCHYYQESARHSYCNADGELLFYILRLTDKNDPNKKSILPLSYGIQQDGNTQPIWALKGFQVEQRPLYHIEQLKNNLASKILIVEGEKTADQALNHFKDENIVCVTWLGGASAVRKTDWTPLYGKEIVIWPDNDEAGFKAAREIVSKLRQIGVGSLKVVNSNTLEKNLPLKWDLADPLPTKCSPSFIKDTFLMAEEKAISINATFKEYLCTEKINQNDYLVTKLQLKEILWRVEERLRPQLEINHDKKSWEIKNILIAETIRLFKEQTNVQNKLKNELGINGELNQKLASQVILKQASTGNSITENQILEMKNTLNQVSLLQNKQNTLQPYIEQQILQKTIDKQIFHSLQRNTINNLLQKETIKVNQQLVNIMKHEHLLASCTQIENQVKKQIQF